MRGLSPQFMQDLLTGDLAVLLERIRLDHTLDLQIREDYLNVYYRGGNLLKLSAGAGGYTAFFDRRYAKGAPLPALPSTVADAADMALWVGAFPELKLAIDLFLGRHPKEEREIQQSICRDNNLGSVSKSTDYFLCDIEYDTPHGRFDFLAVHWPGSARRRRDGRRLVIGEVKQGDHSLKDKSGLHAHLNDVEAFLADSAQVARTKTEMVGLFKQKHTLGLMNNVHTLVGFGDQPPLFLLVLANHVPRSTTLRKQLETMPAAQRCEVQIAQASMVGYGLFDPLVRTLDQVLSLPDSQV